jgi:hypothetical protein
MLIKNIIKLHEADDISGGVDMSRAGELIAGLFNIRTFAHILHLKTNSYAQHIALDGLYNGIVDIADSLAEAIQGKYGIIQKYPVSFSAPTMEPVSFVKESISWFNSARTCVPDSELQNILDEVAQLLDSTQYKLVNLK